MRTMVCLEVLDEHGLIQVEQTTDHLRIDLCRVEGKVDRVDCYHGSDRDYIRVIDYKTGGRDDETPEQLDEKHRLQASCYAYALMRAGYESVEAHFLRIERPGTDNPRDPQIVPYHFEKTDLPALEALIIAKQREASV